MKKYKLPWTHEAVQQLTLYDVLVEFYEDHFEEHPNEARKAVADDGEFFFENTGDPLLDKWEHELSQGLTPDLQEGMPQSVRERLARERDQRKKGQQRVAAVLKKEPVPPQQSDGWSDMLAEQ